MKKPASIFLAILMSLFASLGCVSALASVDIPAEIPVGALTASAKLYKSPSTSKESISTFKKYATVEIIGETESFYRVVSGNTTGYILKKYVSVSEKRALSDPSILTLAMASDNVYQPVPKVIFNTTADENGLGDTPMWAEGIVKSSKTVDKYKLYKIQIDDVYFYVAIEPTFTQNADKLKAGRKVTVYFVYSGHSGVLDAAAGILLDVNAAYDTLTEIPEKLPVSVINASAKLLKKASVKSDTLMSLKANTKVEVIGETSSFYRVVVGEKAGYVQKKYITITDKEATENVSASYKNALKTAEQYLRALPFSREGLIEQLEYEGFTYDEAVYAVDNCGANWFEQAAKSAELYLRVLPFSKDKLIAQLKYEGFTHEQAVYGVEANGL